LFVPLCFFEVLCLISNTPVIVFSLSPIGAITPEVACLPTGPARCHQWPLGLAPPSMSLCSLARAWSASQPLYLLPPTLEPD
jgi:hypothetical protein